LKKKMNPLITVSFFQKEEKGGTAQGEKRTLYIKLRAKITQKRSPAQGHPSEAKKPTVVESGEKSKKELIRGKFKKRYT